MKSKTTFIFTFLILILIVNLSCTSRPSTSAAASLASESVSKPKLVVQITIDQLRGDMPMRFKDRLGDGGFKYLLEKGTHYLNATTLMPIFNMLIRKPRSGMPLYLPEHTPLTMALWQGTGSTRTKDGSSTMSRMIAIPLSARNHSKAKEDRLQISSLQLSVMNWLSPIMDNRVCLASP